MKENATEEEKRVRQEIALYVNAVQLGVVVTLLVWWSFGDANDHSYTAWRTMAIAQMPLSIIYWMLRYK